MPIADLRNLATQRGSTLRELNLNMLLHAPVLALPCQEGAGVSVADISGFGNDGAFKGAGQPAWIQLPSGLWVLDFNSATLDYVEIAPNPTQLDFTSEDFSIVMWIKPEALGGNQYLFINGLSNVEGYLVMVDTGGEVYFRTSQVAASQQSYSSAGGCANGTWTNLGVSRSGASGRIHIDGVDYTAMPGVHIDPVISARTAKIGIYDTLNILAYDGIIALLRIVPCSLSTAEFLNIYNREKHYFGLGDASSILARIANVRSLAAVR